MTAPLRQLGGWSLNEAVQLLLRLSEELQALDTELAGLEQTAVEAAEELTLAHAKALLAADGAQDQRRAQADAATSDERLAAKLAETLVRVQKRKIDILETRIGVGRTIIASVRAEMELER
ncbi:hypothetical protein ACRDU6_27430 [Mycolicibacterium sp. ELW1]|uniref:hypothetical protein n=1 Tax=Mycobacteriaceae TaxID=1762 RepID=UPI0011EE71BF|nr:hypothetical protein [Mycobacterium sp. ELW1]QEN15927.1 hypothetical protein D3H54_23950 [Mycobacterium sp. ELW1]